MPIVFQAEPDPSTDLLEAVAAMAPENPFYTPAYAAAMGMAGEQPWGLGLRDGSRWLSACTGFLKRGRISRWMEIPSLPALGANAPTFWEGLFRFCRRSGITHLNVNTYASIEASIPASPTPTMRTDRIEYVIELRPSDLWRLVRPSHRQRITRGRKAGLQLRCSTSEQDCQIHCEMMGESMRRRERRGEEVSTSIPVEGFLVLLRAGAGVLFQAALDRRVLSSGLVLLSSCGAYYHTSGTCPDGMECGASQFLIFETARHLQGRGFGAFNLGGVSGANPGLHEFKAGFGAIRRPLAAVEFDLQTGLQKTLAGALRGLRGKRAGSLERS
ncbi:MAG TPA: GNAT family N-acetyltransferase [Isosphaeraceae bacterium]|nr:GNAT family N-acetyltransferase [Isosphaeraceae bacterium]